MTITKFFLKTVPLSLFSLILGLTLNTVPVLAQHITRQAPVTVSVPAANITMANVNNLSRNWAGYNATGGIYTGIGGTWIVPKSMGSEISADATWVGIGGVLSKDLIQAGTQTIFTNGQPSYQAWYELLPATSHRVPLSIKPGDSITISVSQQSANNWTISFRNNANGQSYQTSVIYNSSLSSAEWIEEAPSSGRSIISLDNFGSVPLSNLWTIKNGITINPSQAGARPVNMVNSYNQILAQSSVLGNDGASFAVSRTASTTQPLVALYAKSGWQRIGVNIRGFYSSHGYGHYRGNFNESF